MHFSTEQGIMSRSPEYGGPWVCGVLGPAGNDGISRAGEREIETDSWTDVAERWVASALITDSAGVQPGHRSVGHRSWSNIVTQRSQHKREKIITQR